LENLSYVYEKVEKLVSSGMNEVPELIKKKRLENDKALQEMRNYLNYIKMGNFSKAVSEALNPKFCISLYACHSFSDIITYKVAG